MGVFLVNGNTYAKASLQITTSNTYLTNININRIVPFFQVLLAKLQAQNLAKQMVVLDLTDYLSDKGTLPIWTQIGDRLFLSAILSILKQINVPECHAKILFLIKKWAEKYEVYKDLLPHFQELYSRLTQKNVVFDQNLLTYQIYLDPVKYMNMSVNNQNQINIEVDKECEYEERDYNYSEMMKLKLCLIKTDEKNSKVINYIGTIIESIYLANEILDNNDKEKTIDESLKEIFDFLTDANKCLIEIISTDKINEEELIEFIFAIIEDIQRTKSRAETKIKVGSFMSVITERSLKDGLLIPKKKVKKNNSFDPYLSPEIKRDIRIKDLNDLFEVYSDKPKKQNEEINYYEIQKKFKLVPSEGYNDNNGKDYNNNQQNNNSNQPFTADLIDIFCTKEVVIERKNKIDASDILNDNLKAVYNGNSIDYQKKDSAINQQKVFLQLPQGQCNYDNRYQMMPLQLHQGQSNCNCGNKNQMIYYQQHQQYQIDPRNNTINRPMGQSYSNSISK